MLGSAVPGLRKITVLPFPLSSRVAEGCSGRDGALALPSWASLPGACSTPRALEDVKPDPALFPEHPPQPRSPGSGCLVLARDLPDRTLPQENLVPEMTRLGLGGDTRRGQA